jgi:hypothetical protein
LQFRRKIPTWKRDMNHTNSESVNSAGEILVTLDCETVVLPPGRASLSSIRSFLETEALANQRVLAEITVDGCPVDLSLPLENSPFRRIDAVTVPLDDLPLLLLATATHQVNRARESVTAALTLVLINHPSKARELWWNLAAQIKEPVLTLSLMPEQLCQTWCGTNFRKLRRWQLEQIAQIVLRVDESCQSSETICLSDALEKMVLPWLDKLAEHIRLWYDATSAGARLGIKNG